MDKVPAALADVVEPLREADEYTRLQAVRQRGFYNLVTGAPMFLWALPPTLLTLAFAVTWDQGLPSSSRAGWTIGVYLIQWTLFGLSCFPKTFLPLVRRYRPDWQSPLIQADLLKKALEKQFWLQLPFYVAYSLALPLVMALWFLGTVQAMQQGETSQASDASRLALRGLHLAILLGMVGTLAARARKLGDNALALAYLAWLPVGILAPFLDDGQLPSLLAMTVFTFALVLPPVFVGLARLLAPRRWLVK